MYGRFCGSCRGSHDNYLFVPTAALLSTIFSEKNSNFTNVYIRFRFRNTLVVRNSLKVLAFSVAFCILFLVAVLGMSRFFSRTVINWNSYESYYYLCEGCISNVGFAKVVMKTFVCLFNSYNIFFWINMCFWLYNKQSISVLSDGHNMYCSFIWWWLEYWLLALDFWDNYSIRTKFIVHEKKGFLNWKFVFFFVCFRMI